MDLATTLLFFVLLISSTKALDPCGSRSDDSDLSVIPIYGRCSPFNPPRPESWVNTIINMASKDPARVKYLSSLVAQKTTKVPIASGQQILSIGNYVVKVKLGTPGQTMFMVLDTSNDVAWVPCSGCTGCSATTFSPNASSSYGSMDCYLPKCTQARGLSCPATGTTACSFNQSYGGDSSFSANLVQDSLTLANDVVPNFAFGCINTISGQSVPSQGLLGLGRGPMSLLSQSGALYSSVFSYCLPSFKSYYFSGSLKLGPVGQPNNIKTTPLLKNPHRPSLYYVNLTGVSVGRVRVPVAPEYLAFNPNTGAGTIIDSGTVVTRFVQPLYEAIRNEFVKQMKGPFTTIGVFETCFDASAEVEAPPVTLHFQGLSMKLPMENSFLHTSEGSRACLAIAPVPNNVNAAMNVIANLQQQNHRILFDVANSRLGIAREACN
ncbi:Adenine nucleotide alpha hydrolases-like superfamily protein isoform 1 [Hibiscus syriacus]|uniref:Adenine nucleotide alpha hydrolases-like superfamily protein isoform 1 n=1 Tax=Hibiscus syriacus TaxID=106335 RepID=A0A6A2YCM2_HIBSY|nr:aspartyl protease AED3-like [Hibiscus syriacus]KAE8669464.1 Adenine nucleotide alpha hydrolases-like superfamily protein isoform 1 [Hibiscus syriacus]